MKKLIKGIAGLLSAGVISLLAVTLVIQSRLPDDFYVAEGEEFYLSAGLSIQAQKSGHPLAGTAVYGSSGETYLLSLNIFKSVPVKEVQVQVVPRKMVVPGGTPFGIKMFTKGVMVVGISDIQVGSGIVNPAKEAGIKTGDILLSVNGRQLTRNEDVADFISESDGGSVKVSFMRGESVMNASLTPVKTEYDGKYRIGIWVRDSSAGIGTLTYYDPETMSFAGLGHAVCDIDTGKILPLSSGEIVDVNISGVHAGQSGKPGELRGSFLDTRGLGVLQINSEMGVFGTLSYNCIDASPVPMAHKQEIVTGPATILSTISGNKPREFDIVIEKINYMDASSTKNMVIRVNDPDLLRATGGIVQGMSGSPILQDGKLVGAVTHVFVNDPTRGYAIFAENMDSQLRVVDSRSYAA